ncbi:hypothetical protein IG389_07845 [Idiomarina abyssalis]|jgi:hypothetical protein|uniref:Uncharacterized protein n=1 Tax=Idiomarina abyssalis TaxID=86102 RepID=A0A8I1G794_9GAMM|nr:hypothetical protein [Idiomarina abyssalis]MBJ7265645.1 hypothetical protein [Idiomarina abyssalis]MBJ7273829.1 hypothetical protein [Idiomarina abyssalis]MBJ7314465.1 hypothetical protein [Idiomarina abyssalis]|tara:strand:+ start:118 stop:393 length:276 start_codon:yes stop_codon:yes gene_type:complete
MSILFGKKDSQTECTVTDTESKVVLNENGSLEVNLDNPEVLLRLLKSFSDDNSNLQQLLQDIEELKRQKKSSSVIGDFNVSYTPPSGVGSL